MGLRYFFFRIGFVLKKKTGLIKKQFPVDPATITMIAYSEWKGSKAPFFFSDAATLGLVPSPNEALATKAVDIRAGKILFFSGTQFDLGVSYDWVSNPESGYKYDINKHWIDINDYSETSGDIKFVWEKSRFSFLYTLIRDEQHNQNHHGEFIFNEIESWIDKNPVNRGPNYKCSQEISIRVLNWIFALYYYSGQDIVNEQRWQKIMNAVYWQMHHVYHNINFSRIAVRNNHAITESLALYLVGTLFPQMKDSAGWKVHGKKWFEEEVAYQVYEDGTFLQFSMNYHRVVVQLFTWAICIAEKNKESFSQVVYERAYNSVNFLFQCQEETNGYLPNYGANDGALFFPLNNCAFRDFRPQLNALHHLLCGQTLYAEGNTWKEDQCWTGMNTDDSRKYFPLLKKRYGCTQFRDGGYYLIREQHNFTFIRCGDHKDRPSHADNLHIDIWANGRNILIDGGSYKYNTDTKTLKYFMGTESHNTVMLDDNDQMVKGARFIWYYWTQCVSATVEETGDSYLFKGTISAFHQVGKNILHTRIVSTKKNSDVWIVEDIISGKPAQAMMKQYWHLNKDVLPGSVQIHARDGDSGSIVPQKENGFYSGKYGQKEINPQIVFSSNSNKIITTFSL